MSRLKLPGSSLLDRCIGRSTFEYSYAIQITPFAHNLSYDSYIKTLSKYQPTKYKSSWTYITPFGRQNTCRLNLGSSKRTFCLHSDNSDDANDPTQMEIYEYCTGSIRTSLFTILSRHLLPQTLSDRLLHIQYKLACWCAEKIPHSIFDHLFDALYRTKLIDSKIFTSTQPNFFPKWCSSISLVRVLKAKDIDTGELIQELNKEDHPHNTLKGKANINISKDIDYEMSQENEGNDNIEDEAYPMYRMKDEYQSDTIRYYKELTEFDRNYECNEMFLLLSTRYAVSTSSFLSKLLFLPHWITVRLLAQLRHQYILTDLANNLDFVSKKQSENSGDDNRWHKEKSPKKS